MDSERRERAAADLATAERTRQAIAPLSESWPGMTVLDAYEIQLINVRRRVAAGARIRGHKVGLSARAMQDMMGVREPDYGHLLDDMFLFEGDAIPTERYLSPRVEVEVAFMIGRPLVGPGCTVADVIAATEFVLPAIELIDSRIADWKITITDTIADNASSGSAILGGQARRLDQIDDIRLIGAVLQRNGEVVETGAAGAVLGNPVTAVAWLANRIADFGVGIDANSIVLPGSCTRAVAVHPGDVIRADFGGLGGVGVRFV